MDVDAPAFEADFSTFRDVIKELERRLGALIMQVCCWQASFTHTCMLLSRRPPCHSTNRMCTA